MPAHAGIHSLITLMDSRIRGNDNRIFRLE